VSRGGHCSGQDISDPESEDAVLGLAAEPVEQVGVV
jgi:hypothetical protein